jgi:hypothetical protein
MSFETPANASLRFERGASGSRQHIRPEGFARDVKTKRLVLIAARAANSGRD